VAGERPTPGWAIVLGILSVATLPVAIAATRYSDSYDLLHAGFSIPVALGLGWWAVSKARKVRERNDAALGAAGGRRGAAAARALGILGISMGSAAAIAVAVYGVLTYLDG
jgi:hypothetical protein